MSIHRNDMYMIFPGDVKSKTTGEMIHISALDVARFHGLSRKRWRHGRPRDGKTWEYKGSLSPREDWKYEKL